jgi:hypothetical protein
MGTKVVERGIPPMRQIVGRALECNGRMFLLYSFRKVI